ncbi:MAG: DEAD/DEAH box helicase family protein [Planctomycetes bacterium]|nr:DEAD/DEAH box helicase family protein [Planctomycetota bacterium]
MGVEACALFIPKPIQDFLAATIASAGGNEVYFLGRVRWQDKSLAVLEEVDVFARGNQSSAPAIIERAEEWDIAIHNHPGGDLTPSDADNAVASELGNRSVGFAIIDNAAEKLNLVVRPFEREGEQPVDPAEVEAIFQEGGALERELSRSGAEKYEVRPGQIAMAIEVTRAVNEKRVVALEAGTGVGKSFAYLVPAIFWAVKNQRRVVVSTNTINLQEQLTAKDLPFLEHALPVKFNYALIKGRGNYACLRKAAEARGEIKALFESADEERLLNDLLDWTDRTADGSLADLGMTPPEGVWEKVMSETDKSLKVNCPFYSRCFYYQAKRRAFKADIVVVNHHLFFADLAVRRESGNYQWDLILPAYQRVIFDEAHHLEDVASKHLGVRFSQDGMALRFARLVSPRNRQKGLLPFLARKLAQEGEPVAADRLENNYIPLLPEIAARVDEHFQAIATLAEAEAWKESQAAAESDLALLPGPEPSFPAAGAAAVDRSRPAHLLVRLTRDPAQSSFRHALSDRLLEIKKELERLGKINAHAIQALKSAPQLSSDRKASLLLDLTALSSRLEKTMDNIVFFADPAEESHVRWVELQAGRRRGERWNVNLATSPIRVADDLHQAVFEPLETVVLASATLAVEGKVDFFGERVGLSRLSPDRFRFSEFRSPFNYARHVLTLVPTDLPDPGSRRYEESVARMVLEALRILRGRTFVLFTSYQLLRNTYEKLESELIRLGIRPLRQGELNRSEILRQFRTGPNNVLFGTDSFWEGVDVKGKSLECVIITRLPFKVPTEPVQIARLEDLERRGISPFPHFTVPQAVLKFKQGFGRLIRSATDRGVVLVLDRRIITKNYGRAFLRSLPETQLVTAPAPAVLGELKRFFEASG